MNIKNVSRTTLALLLIIGVLSIALASVLVQKQFTNTISIVSAEDLAIWEDAGLTTPLTSYDWGAFTQDEQKEMTFYVENIGNRPLNITFSVSNGGWVLLGGILYRNEPYFEQLKFYDSASTLISPEIVYDTLGIGESWGITIKIDAYANAPYIDALPFTVHIDGTEA